MDRINIGVCMGIACKAKGAEEIYNYLHENVSEDIGSVIPVRCIGDCVNAPIVMCNGKFLKNQTLDDVKKLVEPFIS